MTEEYYHHCHFRMVRRNKLMPWSITKATSGSLISAINHVNSTKSAGLQEVFLTNEWFNKKSKGICLFILSVFSALKLVGRGKDFHQNLTLSQKTNVTYTSDLTMSARQFTIEHYATETGNFSMERIERFVNVDHRMGLLDMEHEPVHIGLGNWNWSLTSILVIGMLYLALVCR